jgi:protein-S-isoprenylcysteine O-methyltransferase Ste14
MDILPEFTLGLFNTYLFMIWLLIFPILSRIIIKQKAVAQLLSTSVPMNHEKTLNILSMTAIILGVLYSFFLPLKITAITFYPGLILFITAFILNFIILLTIRHATPDKPFTQGPYKISRHPLYLALTMMLIANILMSLSPIIFIILFITTIHLILAIPAEEQYCLQKFGQQYQNYQKNTPRFIGLPRNTK